MAENEKSKDSGLPNSTTSQSGAAPKKTSFGTLVIVGATGIAGAYWSGLFTPDRYPLRTEYEITKVCVDGGGAPLSRSRYLEKLEWCQCALESTMKSISFAKYETKPSEFASAFGRSAEACKNKGRS